MTAQEYLTALRESTSKADIQSLHEQARRDKGLKSIEYLKVWLSALERLSTPISAL